MTLQAWKSETGDEYHKRNVSDDTEVHRRIEFWRGILPLLDPKPKSALDVGAGMGANLHALRKLTEAELIAVEPNDTARQVLDRDFYVREGSADDLGDAHADLVLTYGVLIHVPPERIMESVRSLYRACDRYLVIAEYFSPKEEEIEWRGHRDMLWRRDYGSLFLEAFPHLVALGCGFSWKPLTGLDNVTWWVFAKPALCDW